MAQASERLAHQPCVQPRARLAKLRPQLGAGHKAGYGVHDDEAAGVSAHELVDDAQGVLPGLGPRCDQPVRIDPVADERGAMDTGVDVDEGCIVTLLLAGADNVQHQRCLARRRGTKDLGDATAAQATAQRGVECRMARGEGHRLLPWQVVQQLHDAPTDEPLQALEGGAEARHPGSSRVFGLCFFHRSSVCATPATTQLPCRRQQEQRRRRCAGSKVLPIDAACGTFRAVEGENDKRAPDLERETRIGAPDSLRADLEDALAVRHGGAVPAGQQIQVDARVGPGAAYLACAIGDERRAQEVLLFARGPGELLDGPLGALVDYLDAVLLKLLHNERGALPLDWEGRRFSGTTLFIRGEKRDYLAEVEAARLLEEEPVPRAVPWRTRLR